MKIKTTENQLRKTFRECLREMKKMEKEGVSQSKRSKHGYDLEDPVDYDTNGEGLGEDVDRMRRNKDGYGDEFEEGRGMQMRKQIHKPKKSKLGMSLEAIFQEVSPPSEQAEDFIKKNKDLFKKRYGPEWEKILYKAAWSKFGGKK